MKRKIMIHSHITGKEYDLRETVVVSIPKLQALYISHGVELLDLYASEDIYTGYPVVRMVFNKEETQPLYELWNKHELK